jgi:hypothetical protein
MIREKPRGFGANFWDLIGFTICFSTKKCMDRFHELVDRRCSRPPRTRAIAALGAYPELGLRPLRGSRSPAKGAVRRRRGRGTVWWPHLAPTGGEDAARQRGVAAAGAQRWGHAREAERGRRGAGEGWHGSGILGVAFIGAGEDTGGAAGERKGHHQWRPVWELMGHQGREMTSVFEGRGGGVVAHLPAVKVVEGLHGISGAGMSGGGGCVAVRP